MMDFELLTTIDAARRLGRSVDRVRDYEREGKLPAQKTRSGQRLFLRSDVEAFAKSRASDAKDPIVKRESVKSINESTTAASEPLVSAQELERKGILPKWSAYRLARMGLIPCFTVGVKRRGVRFRVSEVVESLRKVRRDTEL